MEKISLSVNLVNGILQYLGTRPYAEVANLISGVQQEAQDAVKPIEQEDKAGGTD